MAIIKANFTRTRAKIKATLRYITHRPGREGEKLTRTLFGQDGEMSKEEAYQLIDAQKGMTYFRMVLNFDAKREDTRRDLDLRDITKQTMVALEERLQRTLRFIAVEHNDHTPLRHIHAIAIVNLKRGEKLTREDFQALRQVATQQARFQRRAREVIRHRLTRGYTQQLHGRAERKARRRRGYRLIRSFQPPVCRTCNQPMVRLAPRLFRCPNCQRELGRDAGLSL